jgi:hypothetical protein
MDPFGRDWKLRLATNRDWHFGPTATFRLLVRRGMAELYLDDWLVNCYYLRGCGGCERISLGLLGRAEGNAVSGLKLWRTSLPGRPAASASSIYNDDYTAEKAVDGNPGTRWSSGLPYGKPEWLQIDFGAARTISKVVIRWEAFAKGYELLVSNDGRRWTSIYTTDRGHGGEETIDGLSAAGRYLRLNCLTRGTENGFSVWDLRTEP